MRGVIGISSNQVQVSDSFDQVESVEGHPMLESAGTVGTFGQPWTLKDKVVLYLRCLKLSPSREVHFSEEDIFSISEYEEMADQLIGSGFTPKFARSVVATHEPLEDPRHWY